MAKERQNKLWENTNYKKIMSESHKGKVGYWKNKRRPEISGKNCHLWRGGLTRLAKKIRSSVEYKEWRSKVFKRDDYTCRKCRRKGLRIQADHYPKSFSVILKENKIKTLKDAIKCKELWKIKKGRTLCESCHKKTKTYLKRWGNGE